MTRAGHALDKVHWDDLQVPASSINPAGSGSPPDMDNNMAGTLLFASNSTEVVGFVLQLPHGYKEGSVLKPHVHWAKTTSASGGVYWQIEYRWSRIGGIMDGSWTTQGNATVATSTPDDDTAERHLITSLGDIDGTGIGISDMLLIHLSRVHDNVEDTYGADARLLEFDIHYQSDDPGSHQEFIKEPA